MDAIAGTQLPMPHAVNAAGDAAGPASARPTVPSKDRKAAARRRQGVPEDFIVPSVFWVRDANLGLWLEYKFGVNQLVAEWRDISKMVATGKKLSDDEMCDGKMYSLQNLDERATDKQLTRPSILDASVANHASSAAAANHLLFTERMLNGADLPAEAQLLRWGEHRGADCGDPRGNQFRHSDLFRPVAHHHQATRGIQRISPCFHFIYWALV